MVKQSEDRFDEQGYYILFDPPRNGNYRFDEQGYYILFDPPRNGNYQFDEQGYYILFDPPHNGNYQFSSICRILREFGFQHSPEALRAELVSYLEANPNDPNGTLLDFYMDVPFSNYLNRMSIDGTFDDGVTLRAAAELFNIEFVIISTLCRVAEATITPQKFAPQGRIYLGHFAENHGEHYVILNPTEDPDISNESFDSEVKKTTDKLILNPVENLINQMVISKWKKNLV